MVTNISKEPATSIFYPEDGTNLRTSTAISIHSIDMSDYRIMRMSVPRPTTIPRTFLRGMKRIK
jgi:hypothetical protein